MTPSAEHHPPRQRTGSRARAVTVGALAVGAAGIAVLWAAGVEFPVAVPPGIVILLLGAVFVALARAPWAPAVGSALGLFVTVGFLVSPTGLDNLTGGHGATIAAGQAVQLVGVVTATIAGVIGTRTERARHRAGAGPDPRGQPSRR
ncbi:hypothetical protein [Cellulomonas dongxiuzhuiae]|uniref:hypothetical protein n=1 Tax=Cellulomonas dongxiuzhuiae TaxID=2819979 RepID=UPI001AAF40B1|nr:hypothetical protein [Cellulomonas dongxiuzhuiae]MBO3089167.1 hypothetical protein [Cellulomonas dongxiuzhuiae]